MECIGVKQFRDNMGAILRRVENGEVIRVLRHGKGVVEMRPVKNNAKQEFLERMIENRIIDGGNGNLGMIKSVKNTMPDADVSDYISEERR